MFLFLTRLHGFTHSQEKKISTPRETILSRLIYGFDDLSQLQALTLQTFLWWCEKSKLFFWQAQSLSWTKIKNTEKNALNNNRHFRKGHGGHSDWCAVELYICK